MQLLKRFSNFWNYKWKDRLTLKRDDLNSYQWSRGLPSLEPVISKKGVKYWQVGKKWMVYLNKENTIFMTIPVGLKTDLATIPWFFRWIISPTDPVIVIPSIIHDYLVSQYGKEDDYLLPKYASKLLNPNYLEPILRPGYEWIDAALLFRKYCLLFSGNTAYIKANVAFFFILLRGFLKRYITKVY